jgi:hypothetical protein
MARAGWAGRASVLRVVSVNSDLPGVFAVGMRPNGVFAVGFLATGVVAVGEVATGVIAIGQLARGVIAIGQGAVGLVSAGQISFGVLWSMGQVGIGGTAGPNQAVWGLFPRPRRRRVLARLRREPWDSVPGQRRRPAWRLALSVTVLAGLTVGWWFAAGQPLVAALS